MKIQLNENGEIGDVFFKLLSAFFWGVGGAILGFLYEFKNASRSDVFLGRGLLVGFASGVLFYYGLTAFLDWIIPKKPSIDLDSMIFKEDGSERTIEEIMELPEFKKLSNFDRKKLIKEIKLYEK